MEAVLAVPQVDPPPPGKPLPAKVRNKGRAWGAAANPRGARREGARARQLPAHADSPGRLLREITEHRLDPKTLTPQQRRACLLLMADGKHTSTELAELFGVTPSCIRMDLKGLREIQGREVREWTLDHVLGYLAMSAERYAAMAIKQQDVALAWTIKRDTVRLLKELGLVGKQEQQSAMQLTINMLGESYDRAREVLAQKLAPELTGEVARSLTESATTPEPVERRAPPPLSLPLRDPDSVDDAQHLDDTDDEHA